MDANTRQLIYAQEIDELWHPASLTKLMTAYMAFKAMAAGQLSQKSVVVISKNAASKPPSKLGLKEGYGLTLNDALTIMLTRSTNDVAAAVGETISGGSESDFASLMNSEAAHLGMTSTHFSNATGLDDDTQVTTARDMALLASAVTTQYPQFRRYFGIKEVRDGTKTYRNTNSLVRKRSDVDGMKTGFLCSSGFNLINRVNLNGRVLISVVLGAHSAIEREKATLKLIELARSPTSTLPLLMPGERKTGQATDISQIVCGHKTKKNLPNSVTLLSNQQSKEEYNYEPMAGYSYQSMGE